MTQRGLTLVNAMQCIVLPHITASVFINDDAGPEAGCTTGLARTPVQNEGTGACRRQAWPTRSGGCGYQWPLRLMHLGAVFLGARRNGWPGSLDGRRRKRVLVKIFGE
jgi:hypothetical protein